MNNTIAELTHAGAALTAPEKHITDTEETVVTANEAIARNKGLSRRLALFLLPCLGLPAAFMLIKAIIISAEIARILDIVYASNLG